MIDQIRSSSTTNPTQRRMAAAMKSPNVNQVLVVLPSSSIKKQPLKLDDPAPAHHNHNHNHNHRNDNVIR
jgi:hypothetical protein